MRRHLTGLLVVVAVLGGCSDTPEQVEGRCRMEAASKVAPTGGEKAYLAAALLVGEYLNGCMAAKGYKSADGGGWIKK